MSFYYETQHFEVPKEGGFDTLVLCSYCGKKCQKREDWDHMSHEGTYYLCDCEDAVKEHEVDEAICRLRWETDHKIAEMEREKPDIDEEMIKKRKFEAELYQLQKKYDCIPEKVLFRKF